MFGCSLGGHSCDIMISVARLIRFPATELSTSKNKITENKLVVSTFCSCLDEVQKRILLADDICEQHIFPAQHKTTALVNKEK